MFNFNVRNLTFRSLRRVHKIMKHTGLILNRHTVDAGVRVRMNTHSLNLYRHIVDIGVRLPHEGDMIELE